MQKIRDLTHKRFGRLCVTGRAEPIRHHAAWSCVCDCGNHKNVVTYSLTSGRTRSCGCLAREWIIAKSAERASKYSVILACKNCGRHVAVTRYYSAHHDFCSTACANEYQRVSNASDFVNKINTKTAHTPSGCWIMHNVTSAHPYGRACINGVQMGAHRAMWIATHGAIPKGMFICHRCDTPGCVNPSHLFVGTPKDNIEDCANKGRARHKAPQGTESPRSKLAVTEVRSIRAMRGTQRGIAKRFSVTHGTIGRIKRRESYVNVN